MPYCVTIQIKQFKKKQIWARVSVESTKYIQKEDKAQKIKLWTAYKDIIYSQRVQDSEGYDFNFFKENFHTWRDEPDKHIM